MNNLANANIEVLKRSGTGFKLHDDLLFIDGNLYISVFKKKGVLPNEEASITAIDITCNVPDCRYTCTSVQEYENHYNLSHRNECLECKKSLPSSHLLELHIEEEHDPFFAIQMEAGKNPMYSCFLSDCKQKSKTPEERKSHCITDHSFPHDFRFYKYSQKHHQTANQQDINAMEVEIQSSSKKSTIYNFGHSKTRCFKVPKTPKIKTDILETNRMVVDLLESLPK